MLSISRTFLQNSFQESYCNIPTHARFSTCLFKWTICVAVPRMILHFSNTGRFILSPPCVWIMLQYPSRFLFTNVCSCVLLFPSLMIASHLASGPSKHSQIFPSVAQSHWFPVHIAQFLKRESERERTWDRKRGRELDRETAGKGETERQRQRECGH